MTLHFLTLLLLDDLTFNAPPLNMEFDSTLPLDVIPLTSLFSCDASFCLPVIDFLMLPDTDFLMLPDVGFLIVPDNVPEGSFS